jgi:hypothetical protein
VDWPFPRKLRQRREEHRYLTLRFDLLELNGTDNIPSALVHTLSAALYAESLLPIAILFQTIVAGDR